VPYGQVLFGIAHASDSYFPVGNSYETSATSFAYTAGGGLDVELNHRLAIRAIEGQFLHTGFPNASNNAQNHMVISAGIVFKLGARELKAPDHIPLPPPPPPAPVVVQAPPRPQIAFSCSTSVVNTTPGEPVEVLGNTMAQPDGLDVTYTWTTTGGTIEGSGSSVTVHTDGLAPGRYHVTGHVVASSDATVTASCEVGFHVNAAPAVAAGPTPAELKAANQQQDHAFHENVKDAYFDYDKWNIRPDTQAAINNAAEYLKQHPDLNVLVGGYSDERGTSEYNVALGLRRSEATRNALIAQGIDPERIQVISYGKGTQVCTTENEACWQQNRRAAFELHR
jgi:peptidoglycan-associated lipoprotein